MPSPISMPFSRTISIRPPAPYNFDASFNCPDHFPTPDNHWQPGARWQTMLWEQVPLGLRFADQGTLEDPCVGLTVYSRAPLDEGFTSRLLDEIVYRYNLRTDLGDFYSRFASHPHLGPVIERWRGMRPFHYSSLYEYLMIAIVLQNATVRRTVSMMHALFENYGSLLSFDGRELFCFWSPEQIAGIPEAELRALKVGYRAKSILRVTQAFAGSDPIDEFALREQTRTEQRQDLLDLYGIGPASVGYLLFGQFHHMDEMDHISPWEQKIYSKLFFDVDPETPLPVSQLLAYFKEQFSPYRGLSVHYIWEDLWWQRQHHPVEWLEKLIRL